MENKTEPRQDDITGWVMAVLIVLAILAAGAFLFRHFWTVFDIAIGIIGGSLQAALLWGFWNKPLEKFGARPEVNNRWTWLVVLIISVLLLSKGPLALCEVTTIILLRLWITPNAPKDEKPAPPAPDSKG